MSTTNPRVDAEEENTENFPVDFAKYAIGALFCITMAGGLFFWWLSDVAHLLGFR